jgi:hypothetical protein
MTKATKDMSEEEYLRKLFYRMNARCEDEVWYVANGICNRFLSPEHLIDYVMNTLAVDPRGLHCHRSNNEWDYEPDNIEFLEPEDHRMVHRILRREEYDESNVFNPFEGGHKYQWEFNYKREQILWTIKDMKDYQEA